MFKLTDLAEVSSQASKQLKVQDRQVVAYMLFGCTGHNDGLMP